MEKAEATNLVNYVRNGFGAVRPYLYGPANYANFIREVFDATEMEKHDDGPTLLQIGDSLLWIEAGDLPEGIRPWVGSVYVYVQDVDAVYQRALERGARSISAPDDKPYDERQAGFTDVANNTWWVSTYKANF